MIDPDFQFNRTQLVHAVDLLGELLASGDHGAPCLPEHLPETGKGEATLDSIPCYPPNTFKAPNTRMAPAAIPPPTAFSIQLRCSSRVLIPPITRSSWPVSVCARCSSVDTARTASSCARRISAA